MQISLNINGEDHKVDVDLRRSLLDVLRHDLALTGTKKGCDHGQCGACTILLDGRRINSCLSLAVMHDGATITTIEGIGTAEDLHPLQRAFVAQDGYQCGYCTPGQIMSALAMLTEAEEGWPSYISESLEAEPDLTDDEIAERMSGNLCRCSAYPRIRQSIAEARAQMRAAK
ncbi:(2Fe-2S)-binding protein [Pseudorhodobacter sp. MZDSW-24AT]|uniref:(2Fe-2S)-binding protein n=1 Tax=Pseudorhodobacter sp. MZDSW-24AT TaxID=2052957 RepID=UPI000C1E8CCA|nr:2Fe-2S iron-sulfur cluster-binding protein [Pseudorhodobacter sp. MZDSW-24AT]PJF08810.1 (2Fe-2S)-binding protein [Pseudorhodobacter sp. MZDSW-24AT]